MAKKGNMTARVLKSLKSRPEVKTPIATEMFLPNHSGDHSAGRVLKTPSKDNDLVNKSYVDSEIASAVTNRHDTWSNVFVTRVNTQSIPNNSDTKVEFNTVKNDTLNEWDEDTNYRFECQTAGTYLVMARVFFSSVAWTSGKFAQISLSTSNHGTIRISRTITGDYTEFVESKGFTITELDAGENMSVLIKHNRGSTTNIYSVDGFSYIIIIRIR